MKLIIDVAAQQMELQDGEKLLERFSISTSRFGLGTEPGSFKTPLGRFRIAEKIGAEAALGTVFKGRLPTGEISPGGGDEDHVLTRILWLDGCEAHNANTKERFIYIHGTNQEDLLGRPASHGCVRMSNADVARLYDLVDVGTPVEIVEESRSCA